MLLGLESVCTAFGTLFPMKACICNALFISTHTQDMLAGRRDNVAALDARRFREHWSCDFWRNYRVPSILKESADSSAVEK